MTDAAANGDTNLLLQAAVDGELDAAGMLAFERSMRENADLAREYERLVALRQAFRGVAKTRASADFRARIEALAVVETAAAAEKTPAPRTVRRAAPFGGWRPAAIAASLAFVLGGGVTSLVLPHPPPETTQNLVASHVRGLISGQTTDVLSSDRHTVKPWFATRSVVSPHVVDLAAEGFPLVGGRLDVIGVTPLPTLIFQHGAHVISLTEVPDSVAHLPTGESSAEGFAVLYWRQGDATFVAISDAQKAELDSFAAAYRKAVAATP